MAAKDDIAFVLAAADEFERQADHLAKSYEPAIRRSSRADRRFADGLRKMAARMTDIDRRLTALERTSIQGPNA